MMLVYVIAALVFLIGLAFLLVGEDAWDKGIGIIVMAAVVISVAIYLFTGYVRRNMADKVQKTPPALSQKR